MCLLCHTIHPACERIVFSKDPFPLFCSQRLRGGTPLLLSDHDLAFGGDEQSFRAAAVVPIQYPFWWSVSCFITVFCYFYICGFGSLQLLLVFVMWSIHLPSHPLSALTVSQESTAAQNTHLNFDIIPLLDCIIGFPFVFPCIFGSFENAET